VAEVVARGRDVFLVDSFDRVSRLMCEFLAVVEELNRAGVRLWSATEPFNSGTPSGQFALKVLAAVAEYECIHNCRERAARAREVADDCAPPPTEASAVRHPSVGG
jgi:DNA invertase Pin-like site-specific DNA recombinase